MDNKHMILKNQNLKEIGDCNVRAPDITGHERQVIILIINMIIMITMITIITMITNHNLPVQYTYFSMSTKDNMSGVFVC